MQPEPIEQDSVELAGYHDLDGRPGFKMALQEVGGRWYLYVAHLWHSGWSVLDVTDPTDPDLVRFIEGPANTWTLQVQVADGRMVTSLEAVSDGWVRVDDPDRDRRQPAAEGVFIWDVETDPTDPERVGHYETGGGGTHRNHYDGGDYAFLSPQFEDYTGKCLAIVDLSDPTAPTEVARWWWPGQAPSDEADATEPAYFHGPAYVQGDRAYLAYGRVGMVILDISDVSDPTLRSRVDFGDFGSRLGVHSAVPVPESDVAVANSEAIRQADGDPLNYTCLVDISDDRPPGFEGSEPVGPKIMSWVPLPRPTDDQPFDSYYEKGGRFGPHNQHHYQGQAGHRKLTDYLVMTYFNAGLRIFDISNPLEPREAGHFVPTDPTERVGAYPQGDLVTQFEDVLVDRRGNIYCTDKNHGLSILKTSLF